MAEKTLVCRADEIAAGAPRIVKIRGLAVGLFRIGNNIHAMLNVCPHRGAPLCEGPQCGTTTLDDTGEITPSPRQRNCPLCLAWLGVRYCDGEVTG